jgi:hypothetical protein
MLPTRLLERLDRQALQVRREWLDFKALME